MSPTGDISVADTASSSGIGLPRLTLSVNLGLEAIGLLTDEEERDLRRYGRGEGFAGSCGLIGNATPVGESILSPSFGVDGDGGKAGSSMPYSSRCIARGGGRFTSATRS